MVEAKFNLRLYWCAKKSTLLVEFLSMLCPGGSRGGSCGTIALSVILAFMGVRGKGWGVEMMVISVSAIDGP